MPHFAHNLVYVYLTTIHAIIGIPANIIMLYLIVFKTPSSFRTYSRILFISALCDLIGVCMFPALIPRSVLFKDANVLDYYGFCTLASVETCWVCTGLGEMMIALNDAFICVSFYYRLRVIGGNEPSVNRTNITNCVVFLLHLPLFFGYTIGHARSHNIVTWTSDLELIEELSGLTHFGIIEFTDPIALTMIGWSSISSFSFFGAALFFRSKTISGLMDSQAHISVSSRHSHLMLIRALNVQLLILSCFFTGVTIYSLMFIGVLQTSVVAQFSVFAISSLQFTLSPLANILFIKPYRRVFGSTNKSKVVATPPQFSFTVSSA